MMSGNNLHSVIDRGIKVSERLRANFEQPKAQVQLIVTNIKNKSCFLI